MDVEITNPIEIQEGDDEEIPLVRDDVEPDIVDAEIVDANLVDANFIQDNNDGNDEDVVSEGDEDEFSYREPDIDSFDRDLEEDDSDDGSGSELCKHIVLSCSATEPAPTPNRRAQQALRNDMERVVGKHANRFIGECSKWVKEFCPLDSRNGIGMDKDAKTRLLDKIKAEWNLPTKADGINVGHALELQCMLLFRGWQYRLKEEHFAENTITHATSNKPLEVHKDKWDWLVNHWADLKQQVTIQGLGLVHDRLEKAEGNVLRGCSARSSRELQTANSELKAKIERMKYEAIERDNKLKERERKHKKEAIEREKKVRAEVMEMLRNLNRGI
ncbi:hypothetical protein Cgig2_017098 [Carnegiea gigantea]|uniref:Uncharacterized protein n=1 Tax=Carnegiea gigantea TaxID=171969 RepID=A0A9Q1GV99_9CARY|nr:hypothetical protein Cgig2_017098 [Carnegiea gigantea]